MLTFIARRVLYSIPVLILSTFFSFLFVSYATNPLLAARSNPRLTPHLIHLLVVQNHLDKPVVVRYFYWVQAIFTQKLGKSLITLKPIWPDITRTMGHTAADHHFRGARHRDRDRCRHLLGDSPVLALR